MCYIFLELYLTINDSPEEEDTILGGTRQNYRFSLLKDFAVFQMSFNRTLTLTNAGISITIRLTSHKVPQGLASAMFNLSPL